MTTDTINFEFAGQVGVEPRLGRVTTAKTFGEVITPGFLDKDKTKSTDFVFVTYNGGSGLFKINKTVLNASLVPVNELPLASHAVTPGESSIIFTDLNIEHHEYRFKCECISPTVDNGDLYMRFSTDNGVTFLDGGSDYRHIRRGFTTSADLGPSGDTSDDKIVLIPDIGNATTPVAGLAGEFVLTDPADASAVTTVAWGDCIYMVVAQGLHSFSGGAVSNNLIAVNAVEFFWASANTFATGSIYMYGNRRAL